MFCRLWSESGVPGISRLASSRSVVSRLCWTLALVALLSLTTRDLVLLAGDYLGHPVHVVLRVEDSRVLVFPAVTVCNVNPAHRGRFCAEGVPKPEAVSKIVCASVAELLQHHCPLLPANRNQSGKGCSQKDRRTQSGPNFGSLLGDLAKSAAKDIVSKVNQELGGAIDQLFRKVFQETTGCSLGGSEEKLPDVVTKLLEDLTVASSGCPLASPQSLSVLNDLASNIVSSLSTCGGSLIRDLSNLVEGEESHSELSGAALLAEAIRWTLLDLQLTSPSQARLVGHNAEDLVVGCVYAGQSCNYSDLAWFFSPSAGNCFTFNALTSEENGGEEEKQLSRKTAFTGPAHGLELTLNLETAWYLPSTGECGARVLVHDRRQRPDPEQDAVHAPSGVITYLGLRMVNISRLPPPYEDACARSWPDQDQLRVWAKAMGYQAYSPQICLKLCLQRRTWDTCGCFAASAPVPPQLAQGRQCTNSTDRACQRWLQVSYYDGRFGCLCPPKCSDINYQKSVSAGTQLPQCSVLSDSRLKKVENYTRRARPWQVAVLLANLAKI